MKLLAKARPPWVNQVRSSGMYAPRVIRADERRPLKYTTALRRSRQCLISSKLLRSRITPVSIAVPEAR